MRQICFYAMLKLPDSGEKLFINRTKADEDEKTRRIIIPSGHLKWLRNLIWHYIL